MRGDYSVVDAVSSCGCARAHPLSVDPEPLIESGIRSEGDSAVINHDAFWRFDGTIHSDRLPSDGTRRYLPIIQWVRASAPSGCSPRATERIRESVRGYSRRFSSRIGGFAGVPVGLWRGLSR